MADPGQSLSSPQTRQSDNESPSIKHQMATQLRVEESTSKTAPAIVSNTPAPVQRRNGRPPKSPGTSPVSFSVSNSQRSRSRRLSGSGSTDHSGRRSNSGSSGDSSPQSGTPASSLDKEDFESLFEEKRTKDFVPSTTDSIVFPGFGDSALKNEAEFQSSLMEWLRSIPSMAHAHSHKRNDVVYIGGKRKRDGEKMEGSIRSALQNYKAHLESRNKDVQWEEYPQDVRGGLITKGSRADIGCIDLDTHLFYVGELKNAGNYSIDDAVRQGAAYMYHVLWWYRAVQSLNVGEVYGFCICGPECRKMNRSLLTVTFLHLKLPEKIGGPMQLFRHDETSGLDSRKMKASMAKLGVFLTRKHYDLSKIPTLLDKMQLPGSMMLPQEFLPSRDEMEVVPSGAAALVLKVRRDCLDQMNFFFDSPATGKKFRKITKCFKEDEHIYIKLVNAATGKDWQKKKAFRALLDEPSTELGLGAYENYSYLDNTACILIFMHDMGVPIHDQLPLELPFERFCEEYLALTRKVEKIWEENMVVHGDIHQGNVIYQSTAERGHKLSLIDWDESSKKKPLERNVTKTHHKERYPESFLDDGLAFTQVQLIVLFRDIAKDYQKYLGVKEINSSVTITISETKCPNPIKFVVTPSKERVKVLFDALKKTLSPTRC